MELRTFRANRFFNSYYLPVLTAFWLPPRIELDERGVTRKAWSLFGLTGVEEYVVYESVASVRVHNGIFMATLVIETRGGATSDIFLRAVSRSVAREAVKLIRARKADADNRVPPV